MIEATIDTFTYIRKLTRGLTKGLAAEQMLTIPDGFDNNLAWNIGHIIVAQSGLIYHSAGVEQRFVNREMVQMYRPGTSPADWAAPPDVDELVTTLVEQSKQMVADFAEGKFNDVAYREMTTATGKVLTSVDQGVAFNNFHEGLHLGYMLALRNRV